MKRKKIFFIPVILVIFLFSGCISSILTKSLFMPKRQPLVKNPADYGMKYEDIEFKSPDGVNIKGWLIPGTSDKLIIITHPLPFTRYGFSTKDQGVFKVTDVEVELLKTAKALNQKGYSILTFDFRNHGESGEANNGYAGVGLNEWPDIAGALDYINSKDDLNTKEIAFVSHCMGANSTIIAMSKAKDKFENVKCLVAIQPVSMNVLVPCMVKDQYPAFSSYVPGINDQIKKLSGNALDDMSPLDYVKDIDVPVLYVQVKNDPWTKQADIEQIYSATPGTKEMFWIEGNDLERFDGYNYFGNYPEKLLEFLGKYL